MIFGSFYCQITKVSFYKLWFDEKIILTSFILLKLSLDWFTGRTSGQGSLSCPRLKTEANSPIRIANDVPVQLRLTFEHLHSFYNSATQFWCLVHIEEAKFKVSAKMVWENTTVICDETVFNYNAPVEQMSARVSVLVNNEEDMLDTQVITVYKCSVLGSYRGAQDCTLCSLKSRSHGCGWCPKIGCVSASRCPTRCVLTNFLELVIWDC